MHKTSLFHSKLYYIHVFSTRFPTPPPRYTKSDTIRYAPYPTPPLKNSTPLYYHAPHPPPNVTNEQLRPRHAKVRPTWGCQNSRNAFISFFLTTSSICFNRTTHNVLHSSARAQVYDTRATTKLSPRCPKSQAARPSAPQA